MDRLFQDGKKVAIFALCDKRMSLVSNKKMGLCLHMLPDSHMKQVIEDARISLIVGVVVVEINST